MLQALLRNPNVPPPNDCGDPRGTPRLQELLLWDMGTSAVPTWGSQRALVSPERACPSAAVPPEPSEKGFPPFPPFPAWPATAACPSGFGPTCGTSAAATSWFPPVLYEAVPLSISSVY